MNLCVTLYQQQLAGAYLIVKNMHQRIILITSWLEKLNVFGGMRYALISGTKSLFFSLLWHSFADKDVILFCLQEEQACSKEEYAVAKHLRFNTPAHTGRLAGMTVKCFIGIFFPVLIYLTKAEYKCSLCLLLWIYNLFICCCQELCSLF